MPVSSPRSSGCRATDWIIEPKMFPIPMPAPREPSPTPSASPIALPASATSPVVCARTMSITFSSLVLGLDRRADVDGGQGREDKRLDADDDDDLEDVEDRRGTDDQHERPRLEDEDQPEERQDQDVPREHVREETNAQRDQAHELTEDLQRHDQPQQGLRRVGNTALEVAHGPVPPDALVVGEGERQQRERERH